MNEPRVIFDPQIPGIRVLSSDAFARAICYAVYGDGSGCCGADHEVLCGSEECVGLMVKDITRLAAIVAVAAVAPGPFFCVGVVNPQDRYAPWYAELQAAITGLRRA
jgi:hypothetical protein